MIESKSQEGLETTIAGAIINSREAAKTRKPKMDSELASHAGGY